MKDYPPSAAPGSFNLDNIQKKIEAGLVGKQLATQVSARGFDAYFAERPRLSKPNSGSLE